MAEIKLILKQIQFRNDQQILPIPRDSERGFPLLEIREYHCSFTI